jgi:cell division protein FtsQ
LSRVTSPLPRPPELRGKMPPARAGSAKAPPIKDRPGRFKLLWRRKRKLLRPALYASGLLALGVGFVGIVHVLGKGPTFRERLGQATAQFGLRVREIVIDGRQKTPEPLLRAALGVRNGEPILAFSAAQARSRIEMINWVKSATVERRLPGTIVVQLNERRPFAVWQNQGKFALIDRGGNIVADSDVAAFAGQLPLVVGSGAPRAAANLIDALASQPRLQSRVTAAVRVGERRWDLRMNNGADVLLPEGAEMQALAKLTSLQNTHALLDRPLETVDMRLPDRLVVHPMPPPAPMQTPPEKSDEAQPQQPNPSSSAARKPT